MRLRLLWPTASEFGPAWLIRVNKLGQQADLDLLVRMESRERPVDYFIASPADVLVRFPRALTASVPPNMVRFWCPEKAMLLERLGAIARLHSQPQDTHPG